MTHKIDKIVHIGSIKPDHTQVPMQIFCKIEYESGRLSISGVEGPLRSGNCRGSCGQIIMSYVEYDKRGHASLQDIVPAQNWNADKIKAFFDLWDKWHLNDMHSECEHQRALGWTYENHRGMICIKPRKVILIDEYDDGTVNDGVEYFDEYHGHECPVCGYSIGSAWLTEEVPQEVLNWLNDLPKTDITPAWV